MNSIRGRQNHRWQEIGTEQIRKGDVRERSMNNPWLESPSAIEMAWLQVRMAWQSVKNTRLDQEKKDVIACLIRHYRSTGQSDRLCSEFEQVLLRLEEEHELRVKELGREGRRVAKQVNNIIQVIRDTNAARMQHCREKVEETPAIIADWKEVMHLLFNHPQTGADVSIA